MKKDNKKQKKEVDLSKYKMSKELKILLANGLSKQVNKNNFHGKSFGEIHNVSLRNAFIMGELKASSVQRNTMEYTVV